MTKAPTLNGMILGQAEAATRAVLDRLLAARGTTFLQWVALNLLTLSGGALAEEQLVARVRRGLKVDGPPVVAALDGLLSGGHVRRRSGDASFVELTTSGAALHRRLREGVDAVTGRLYRDLPADDLVVAARVLAVLTERADAELGEAPGGAS